MRHRQFPLLVGVFARSALWLPLVPMVVIAYGLLVWADLRGSTGAILWLLRAGAFLLAVGVTHVLDDAAATFTASSPTRLGVRRAAPIAVMLAAVGMAWLGLLGYGAGLSTDPVPAAGLTVELGTLLALALVQAALFGAVAAGPVLIVTILLALRMPARWSLLQGEPGDAVWTAAHQRWLVLFAVAVAALVWTSRDPAARRGVLT